MDDKKCKPQNHVRVITRHVTDVSKAHPAGDTLAVKQFCDCRQQDLGRQEVIVIYASNKGPDSGMHCLMELARVLPGWLRTGGNTAGGGQCVSIEHTVDGEWKEWRSVSINGAFDLAEKMIAAIGQ